MATRAAVALHDLSTSIPSELGSDGSLGTNVMRQITGIHNLCGERITAPNQVNSCAALGCFVADADRIVAPDERYWSIGFSVRPGEDLPVLEKDFRLASSLDRKSIAGRIGNADSTFPCHREPTGRKPRIWCAIGPIESDSRIDSHDSQLIRRCRRPVVANQAGSGNRLANRRRDNNRCVREQYGSKTGPNRLELHVGFPFSAEQLNGLRAC